MCGIPGLQNSLVNVPPNKGPRTLAIPHTAPITAVKAGRFARGTDLAMIINAPENMPAPPMPATARPMMSATELGLAPQMAEPISKTKTAPTKVHLMDNIV